MIYFMPETVLSDYARRIFNLGPTGDVPPVCLQIAADIQAAETAIKTAPSPGAAREARDTLASIHRRIHDMMTPPVQRRCGIMAQTQKSQGRNEGPSAPI